MPADLELRCDADKIQRVFDNLIRNAVNYSFENSEIQITASVSDTAVNLNFVNSGNTILAEQLERIFEQFYRLDASRSSRTGGAGLGLAISKQIVELHDGRIMATSHDDTICFAVELPLS
jgi:two-component system sensor histidine kinase VanS